MNLTKMLSIAVLLVTSFSMTALAQAPGEERIHPMQRYLRIMYFCEMRTDHDTGDSPAALV